MSKRAMRAITRVSNDVHLYASVGHSPYISVDDEATAAAVEAMRNAIRAVVRAEMERDAEAKRVADEQREANTVALTESIRAHLGITPEGIAAGEVVQGSSDALAAHLIAEGWTRRGEAS